MTHGAGVLHHATLPYRGGAVRVARLLLAAQIAAGDPAALSCEVAETDPEALAMTGDRSAPPLFGPTSPGDFARLLAGWPAETRAHLHTSTDWPALLGGLTRIPPAQPSFLTLHDASVLTGGCAYPLNCPHFPACAADCPRGFPDARARQTETLELLRALAPVIVAPSHWLAGLARDVLPENPPRVIPNGVPWPPLAQLPTRTRARATLGVAPGARVALFAAHGGARAAYKSGARWPEFWSALRAGLPDALAFAAGGDEAGGRDGLTVWPYVDRAKLRLLMRAADVLVYPTLADNHPLVLLEAASMELPVASFVVGGVSEIVVDGETGLLAKPGDDAGLVCTARTLLADPVLARRLGRAARARGERRFVVGRMAGDYAALAQATATGPRWNT